MTLRLIKTVFIILFMKQRATASPKNIVRHLPLLL